MNSLVRLVSPAKKVGGPPTTDSCPFEPCFDALEESSRALARRVPVHLVALCDIAFTRTGVTVD